MHKSSVYLPDDLKAALGDVAARSGRSEADLIRTAIENLVRTGAAPATEPPSVPTIARPAVIGVGVGPGDPALATEQARLTLGAADRVVVITTDARSVGRAEMVVRALAPPARVVRVPFAIGGDDAARRASTLDVVDAAVAGADAGELVAVAVLGDPSQWTVFPDVAAEIGRIRPHLRIDGVPGVTSYQTVAGRGAISLGRSGTPLIVVDDVADLDAALARHEATVVLFKASTDAVALQQIAAAHDRDAVVGELTGLPGERTSPLGSLMPGPISYLATVVFPARAHDRIGAP